MPRRHECIGRRGSILLVLAVTDLLYGSAVVYARSKIDELRAASPATSSVSVWWPVTQDELFWIPTEIWGWLWIAAGVVLLSGVCRRHDRWQFTLATVIKVIWACAAGFRSAAGSGLWGVTALYVGFASVVFIITGWPEQEPTPPPILEKGAK